MFRNIISLSLSLAPYGFVEALVTPLGPIVERVTLLAVYRVARRDTVAYCEEKGRSVFIVDISLQRIPTYSRHQTLPGNNRSLSLSVSFSFSLPVVETLLRIQSSFPESSRREYETAAVDKDS